MNCESVIFLVCKDPDTSLWYGLDWSNRLVLGVSIISSEWISPLGITVVEDQVASPITKVRVAGGGRFQKYRITNRVTYSTGEKDDQSIDFEIEER